MNKKILVITPRFPYPEAGACEQDRAEGIRQFQRLGFEVRVIGKIFAWQNKEEIAELWKREGVKVELVLYKYQQAVPFIQKLKGVFQGCLDGSALEYIEPEIQSALDKSLTEFKPNLVWFDYTYLWPLYKIVKKQNIPIITRSINFEARHFLEEDSKGLINYLKYIPKYLTEVITARASDITFSISPLEKKMYEKIKAKKVVNLPLRALWKKLNTHVPRETDSLRVFFSGSTYNVAHNRRALEFIIKDLAPKIYKKYSNKFTFHVTGSKFPEDLKKYIANNVEYDGFVGDMDGFLQNMDIAVVPSLYGAGMQQKIFEPLARGFPTVTNRRGLAGYDFVKGEELLLAEDASQYLKALEDLVSFDLRNKLSQNCRKKSESLFNQEIMDRIVEENIKNI